MFTDGIISGRYRQYKYGQDTSAKRRIHLLKNMFKTKKNN